MAFWEALTEEEQERYSLACARLMEIPSETIVQDPGRSFFQQQARFLLRLEDLRQALEMEALEDTSLEEWEALNKELYQDILPDHYSVCYGNPDVASAVFGKEIGQMISFLYAELRGAIAFAFEDRERDMLLLMELFLQVYAAFAGNAPDEKQLREILYWYCSDYSDQFVDDRTRELVDPSLDFLREIVMESDLTDLRYLYRTGEYITENETGMAAYLNALPEEEIEAMAATWTEGYRIGFEVQRKDLSKKKTAVILYRLGFERMVRCAVRRLKEMGLDSILYRCPAHAVNKRAQSRGGCYGAVPNPQFDYDHRNDAALFIDARSVTRRLQALQQAFEKRKDLAAVQAGPLVLEVFGETPFRPQAKDTALRLSEEQQQEQVRYAGEAGQITNRYIKGEERSFTIISYPVPEIGAAFPDIFRETIRINTLDYKKYQKIQQHLIDALDRGYAARIRGKGKNETDLVVQFHELTDPEKQTNFENCVADVNIPVGEVFTSPVLEGTNGLLHVCSVALEGFRFENLRIRLQDGMVTEYGCGNFADPEQGKQYIRENILFRHPTLPIGEFAIGTNTTAYQVARKYGIAEVLPILIAEKTGPHFAFGDTCYSWQEDVDVYNPDGKEIIARDNSCSILRKENPEKAYFNCHTDITIPYDELGSIAVLCSDGSEILLLENGRFVLPGTEELNIPLDELPDERRTGHTAG
ncbi:MAG: aminopeptidase [Eubacterium sp.]|nr:aminopeptidase [Eubacterium sp.]